MARLSDGGKTDTGMALVTFDAGGNASLTASFRESFASPPQVIVRRLAVDTGTVSIDATSTGFTATWSGSIIRGQSRRIAWLAMEDS